MNPLVVFVDLSRLLNPVFFSCQGMCGGDVVWAVRTPGGINQCEASLAIMNYEAWLAIIKRLFRIISHYEAIMKHY